MFYNFFLTKFGFLKILCLVKIQMHCGKTQVYCDCLTLLIRSRQKFLWVEILAEQISALHRIKNCEFRGIYSCDWIIYFEISRNLFSQWTDLKGQGGCNYEIIYIKSTSKLNYYLVHVKACLHNYVATSWFYLSFLVHIVQLFDRNSNTHTPKKQGKMIFGEQIFAMEPISTILAEFIFAIWCQNFLTNRKNFCPLIAFSLGFFKVK